MFKYELPPYQSILISIIICRLSFSISIETVNNNHLDNMCYNVVSNYTEARQALADGYDAAGMAYHVTPFPHFSGNCFWVRSEYVRQLSPLIYGVRNFNFYLDYPDRHDAEKWVCSRPGQFFNMTHHYSQSKYYGLTY